MSNQVELPSKLEKVNKEIKRIEISSQELSLQLQPVEESILANNHKYLMSYESIAEFLHSSYDNLKVMENALKYTKDIPAFITMMIDIIVIKDLITERCLKNRIARIIKKLVVCNDSSDFDLEGGSSTDSSCMEV